MDSSLKSNKSLINERLSQINSRLGGNYNPNRESVDAQNLKDAFNRKISLNDQRNFNNLLKGVSIKDVDILPTMNFREPAINSFSTQGFPHHPLRGGS